MWIWVEECQHKTQASRVCLRIALISPEAQPA